MYRRSAFTVLEVVLVILLIGLVVGFLYPDLEMTLRSRRLEESSDRLRSLLVMCRARAMKDGIKYRVQLPGTPDPLDKFADKQVDVPFETVQPEVYRQSDPLSFPDAFDRVDEEWTREAFVQDGVRCVAVLGGKPNFDINDTSSPIAGPSVKKGDKTEFVPLTFNPDGSCDWVTFVMTDLPFDADVQAGDITRIYNLIVDGRTGQSWFQRALLVEEVRTMQEHGASPILHMDFKSPDLITEANILQVHMSSTGLSTGPQLPQAGGAK